MKQKYFKTRREAKKAQEERTERCNVNRIWRVKKGIHKGTFAVCSEIEWLNTYN